MVCGYVYDEEAAGVVWEDLAEDWTCPVCFSAKSYFMKKEDAASEDIEAAATTAGAAHTPVATEVTIESYLTDWARTSDELEVHMADIHHMAMLGSSVIEPMRTRRPVITWDDILIKGAQLHRLPLDHGEGVSTRTVIGPSATKPLVMDTPVYITHMSFGALSREAKLALARGSAAMGTAMCSGEGGILPESIESAHRYIFEYVPNEYSVTEENLRRADAIEIKIGQSAKPGMGGHLPGSKVTGEIAEIRGRPEGEDIISPSRFRDIGGKDDLRAKVDWLREASEGRPIGIKVAAGHIEADLAVALHARPDFVTVDGRAGATGAAPKVVKDSVSIPTIFALHRARRFLDGEGADDISLLITGQLRVSSDFAKALAMGADAVAIGTAAMMAIGCQQYRICNTGNCPVGIATQDPILRERLDVDLSARRLENFLRVSAEELRAFARLTGRSDVHYLSIDDLCTTNSEISGHTDIEHV
jgi:glutamate synthase domain-containing protein 2